LINPFKFSGIFDDPAFCNREKEQKALKQFISNSQNVLLYSHRHYGKSSLIFRVFKKLRGITPVYIDLYGTTTPEGFTVALLKGISRIEPKPSRLMKSVRETIRSMTVKFGMDPVPGMPTAAPDFSRGVDYQTLDELFLLLTRLASKKKMVVAFDEFQEMAAYGGEPFEKVLKKSMQNRGNISYLFVGSQRHIITEMFNDRSRPGLSTEPRSGRSTIHFSDAGSNRDNSPYQPRDDACGLCSSLFQLFFNH
jgi:uncharacterized protein